MKIAVMTDSGANLSSDFVKDNANLFVLPLMINIDGVSYKDQVDISSEEIYEKLDTHDISSSLPLPQDFETLIEQIKEEGYTQLLVINISSGLSGTFNSLRLAIEEYSDIKIAQFDSKTLAGAQGLLVEYALELIKEKATMKKIMTLLEEARLEDIFAGYTLNTLKYLRRGGRIGRVEGTIADIIRIKPIIGLNEEGVYVTLAKVFGFKRALISMRKLLVEKFGQDLIDLVIHFGEDLQKAKELATLLAKELNIRKLRVTQLTPVLGIHTGSDMFAYVARRVK